MKTPDNLLKQELNNGTRPGTERNNGRFRPGVSGNPQGRPQGSRNRSSLLVENLLDGRAEALAEKAIEMALGGNVLALRLCLERLLPAQKERQMVLELPHPATGQGILDGFASIADALAAGELTPSETNSAAALLESARRALETADLAMRIYDLEKRVKEGDEGDHGTEKQS